MFLSSNNGQVWTPTGLSNNVVLSLIVCNGYLFAGTYSGVWMAPLSNLGLNEITENNIAVYPNPNTGKFQVASPKFQIQSLEIYNTLGEKVYSMSVTGYSSPVTVNIADKPSGIYVVKITTVNGIAIKEIVKE